ncbi:MAG: TolC family protein, partial [Verrucomicrobiota bacterium]
RSAKSKAKAMETRAATALVNLMGLDHGTVVEPAETDLPQMEKIPELPKLINVALEANPDLGRVRAGIGAATAKLREARSGRKPTVGLLATYVHIENELDTGMMDPQNKDFAMVGIGAQLPLFTGFRTKGQVLEAELQLEKLKMQEEALIEGIALQVEHAHAEYESALEREGSTAEGLKAASENRDLNVRAYQEELVETADVIQAQITEALLDANYQRTLYECIEARANLGFLMGAEASTFTEETL